ncbi:hypothetical protein [Arthrobacter sp. FW306-04-A]|uniref:hypothetical protein n=1 Tax=Arthrobacter sp. FW306-04-A TaxID=2879619 RepID=UPI0037BF8D95|nr:hypothetical protein LFT43_03065 [Arthrobacter sp. FW306-04-A]
MTLKTFRKANATINARMMGVEATAYQAGHSKVSMTQKHHVEEYKEALNTRGALNAFNPDPPKPPGMAYSREWAHTEAESSEFMVGHGWNEHFSLFPQEQTRRSKPN